MEPKTWAEPVPPPRPTSADGAPMRNGRPYTHYGKANPRGDVARNPRTVEMEERRMRYIQGNSLHHVLADTMARCLEDMPEDPCTYLARNLIEVGQKRGALPAPTSSKLDDLRAEAQMLREQLEQLHKVSHEPVRAMEEWNESDADREVQMVTEKRMKTRSPAWSIESADAATPTTVEIRPEQQRERSSVSTMAREPSAGEVEVVEAAEAPAPREPSNEAVHAKKAEVSKITRVELEPQVTIEPASPIQAPSPVRTPPAPPAAPPPPPVEVADASVQTDIEPMDPTLLSFSFSATNHTTLPPPNGGHHLGLLNMTRSEDDVAVSVPVPPAAQLVVPDSARPQVTVCTKCQKKITAQDDDDAAQNSQSQCEPSTPATPQLPRSGQALVYPGFAMPEGLLVHVGPDLGAATYAGHALMRVDDLHRTLNGTWKVVQAWGLARFVELFYTVFDRLDVNRSMKLKAVDHRSTVGRDVGSALMHSIDDFFRTGFLSRPLATWKLIAAHFRESEMDERLTWDDFTFAASAFVDAMSDIAQTFGIYVDHSLSGCWLRLFALMANTILVEVEIQDERQADPQKSSHAPNVLFCEDLERYGQMKQRLADVLFLPTESLVDYSDSLDIVDMDETHDALVTMLAQKQFGVPVHPHHMASVCTIILCGLRDGTLLADRIRVGPWMTRLKITRDEFASLNDVIVNVIEVDDELFQEVWNAVTALVFNPYYETASRFGLEATVLSALVRSWECVVPNAAELKCPMYESDVNLEALTDMLESVFPLLHDWGAFQSTMHMHIESSGRFGINITNSQDVEMEYLSRMTSLIDTRFTESISKAWEAVWKLIMGEILSSTYRVGAESFHAKPKKSKHLWDGFGGPEKLTLCKVLVQRLGLRGLTEPQLCLLFCQVLNAEEGFSPGTPLYEDVVLHRLLTVAKYPSNQDLADALDEAFTSMLLPQDNRKESVECWIQLLSVFPWTESSAVYGSENQASLPIYITRPLASRSVREAVSTGAVQKLQRDGSPIDTQEAIERTKEILMQTNVQVMIRMLNHVFRVFGWDSGSFCSAIAMTAVSQFSFEDALAYQVLVSILPGILAKAMRVQRFSISLPAGLTGTHDDHSAGSTTPTEESGSTEPAQDGMNDSKNGSQSHWFSAEIISSSWKRLKAKDCFVNAVWMKLVLLCPEFKNNLYLVWKERTVMDVLSDLINHLGKYRKLNDKGKDQVLRSAITMYLEFNFQPHHLPKLVEAVMFVVKHFDPVATGSGGAESVNAWTRLVHGVIRPHLEAVLPPTWQQREVIIMSFQEKSFVVHDFVNDLVYKTGCEDDGQEKELNAVCQIMQALVYTGYNRLLLDELSTKYVCRGGREVFMKFKEDFVHSLKKYTNYNSNAGLRRAWENMFGFLGLTVISTGPQAQLQGGSGAVFAAMAASYWSKCENFQTGIIYRFLQKFYEKEPLAARVWAHIPQFRQVKRVWWFVNCLFHNPSWASTLLQCAGERWQREGMTEQHLRQIPDVLIATFFEFTPQMNSALERGWRSLLDKAVENLCSSLTTEEVTPPTAEDMKIVVQSFQLTNQSRDTFLSTMQTLDPCCPEAVLHSVIDVVVESINECRDHTTASLSALVCASDDKTYEIWSIVQGLISTVCRDGVSSYTREMAWRKFFKYRIAPQITHDEAQLELYKKRNQISSASDIFNPDKDAVIAHHRKFCADYLQDPHEIDKLFWNLFLSSEAYMPECLTPEKYFEVVSDMEGKGNVLAVLDAALCFSDDWGHRDEWLHPYFLTFHTLFTASQAEELLRMMCATYQSLCDTLFCEDPDWKSARERVVRGIGWISRNVSKELFAYAGRQQGEDKRFEEHLMAGNVTTTFYQEKLNFVNFPFPAEYLHTVTAMWGRADRKMVTLALERLMTELSLSARAIFTNDIIERFTLFFLEEMIMFINKCYTLERIRPIVQQLALELALKGVLPAHFKYLHCACCNVILEESQIKDANSTAAHAWIAVLGSIIKCLKGSPTPTPFTFKEARENITRMIRKELGAVDWKSIVNAIPEFNEVHKNAITAQCQSLILCMGKLILSYTGLQDSNEHLNTLKDSLSRISDQELISLADYLYRFRLPMFDPLVKVFFPLVSLGTLYVESAINGGQDALGMSMSIGGQQPPL